MKLQLNILYFILSDCLSTYAEQLKMAPPTVTRFDTSSDDESSTEDESSTDDEGNNLMQIECTCKLFTT